MVLTGEGCAEGGRTIGGGSGWRGVRIQCFGCQINKYVVDSWKTKLDQEQVIGQAEIYPVYIARLTWAKYIKGRRVIYFIDNESARLSLVKSYSPILPSLKIVMNCIEWDFDHKSDAWYARVPTVCNISDGPSRMRIDGYLETLGPEIVQPVCPSGHDPIVTLK